MRWRSHANGMASSPGQGLSGPGISGHDLTRPEGDAIAAQPDESTGATEFVERRASFRVPLAVPAQVVSSDGRPEGAITLDCSTGGCALQLPDPVGPVGSIVALTIELDDGPVQTKAAIRYCQEAGAGYRAGFAFVALGAGNERRIARLVAAQDRRTSIRVAVATSVEYRIDRDGEVFRHTSSTDISRGGIRFRLVSPCQAGDRLEMLIKVERERVAVRGTIVRIDRREHGAYAGICFDPPSTFHQRDLQAAIRRFADEFPRVA